MRRVLVVAEYFHEDKQGGYRRAANFLRGNRAWRFILPSHRTDGDWASGSNSWGSTIPVPVPARRPFRGRIGGWLRFTLTCCRLILKSEPPISAVYLVAQPSWWGLPACLIARLRKVPCILDLGDPARASGSGVRGLMNSLAERILRRLSAEIIVASPDFAEPGDTPILTGINDEFFQVGKERVESRPPNPRDGGEVIYCGTFGPLQCLEGIVRAWRDVSSQCPRLHLTLIGRGIGTEGRKLRRLARDLGLVGFVSVEDSIPPDEVPRRLRRADWGLISIADRPGLDYAVPTKMLEYFAAGLPVLAVGSRRVGKILEESGGGIWLSPAEVFNSGGGKKFVHALDCDPAPLSRRAFTFALRNLKRDAYQSRVSALIARHARPWSSAVDRGLASLQRDAIVRNGPLPPDMLGVLHSFAPSRLPEADRWVYVEATAYAASLYLCLHRLNPEDRFLETAVSMGRWLLHCQTPEGALPYHLHLSDGSIQGPLHSFDTAMVIRTWLLLDRVAPESGWKDAALRAGRWLVRRMQREDGSFEAALSLRDEPLPPHAPECHYGTGGILHLKISLALRDLARVFDENPEFPAALSKLLDWGKHSQRSDGAFAVAPGSGLVHCHTHSYALEGLLPFPGFSDDWVCGVRWSRDRLLPGGVMPETVDETTEEFPPLDATAQTLRLLALAARQTESGEREMFASAAERIARHLRRCQMRDGKWGFRPGDDLRAGPPVWWTIFAVSALLFWEREELDASWIF